MLDIDVNLSVRYGAITGGHLTLSKTLSKMQGFASKSIEFGPDLIGRQLHKIESWEDALEPYLSEIHPSSKFQLSNWLEEMMPRPTLPSH